MLSRSIRRVPSAAAPTRLLVVRSGGATGRAISSAPAAAPPAAPAPASDATSSSAAAAHRLHVSARYAARHIDVSLVQRRALEKWPAGSFDTHLDRDWANFTIPAFRYVLEAGEESRFDEAATYPEVHIAASRRGSIVTINTCKVGHLKSEGAGATAVPQAPRHPVFSVRDLLDDALPHDARDDVIEDMEIVVDSTLARFCAFREGALWLRELDADSVRIVNGCMAQTVNLQFFEGQVDKMYDTVGEIHKSLEALSSNSLWASWATSIQRLVPSTEAAKAAKRFGSATLYRHLGTNNAISNNLMLSGLRTTVRPGATAWKDERYTELQELLWEEFDLEERYEELQRKLTYVNDSIKYALEVSKDNKSILVERLIVLLISAELALSLANKELPQRTLAYLQSLLA